MNETQDHRSALDEFASQPQANLPVVALSNSSPARLDIPHGAIQVQEKRNVAEIRKTLREHAAMLGERGYYHWEVKNRRKGTVDIVEGVSIKGANALVRAYKNCHVSCPIIVDLGTHWRFHAVFVDYENGIEMERSFLQRKNVAGMGDDVDRKQDIAYQSGVSKAERNVVLNVLDIEAEFLLEECKGNLVKRVGSDPDRWRNTIRDRLAERNIELQRVELVIGRVIDDWLAPDIAKVIASMRAIADGMVRADDVFPPLAQEQKDNAGTVALDDFASSGEAAKGSDAEATPPTQRASNRAKAKAPDPAAGDGGDDAANTAAASPADKIAKLKAGLASARDEATVHQVWENLGLDTHFNDDPFGRREAWKLCTDRIDDLNRGGDDGQA